MDLILSLSSVFVSYAFKDFFCRKTLIVLLPSKQVHKCVTFPGIYGKTSKRNILKALIDMDLYTINYNISHLY
jgi:hypothetical protein